MRILTAEYVLPISSEPIVRGAVAIEGSRIKGVGRTDEIVAAFPDTDVTDFGLAAILPGFINCHSHLEVTSMRGALDDVEHDFTSWLLKLNDIRSGLSQGDIEAAALMGAREGAAAGVTCFGDIGRYGEAGLKALTTVGLRGVLFQETEFTPENATALADFEKLREKFLSLRERSTELVEIGLSPHSPYTVSRKLFEMITGYAIDENIKLAIHTAESVDEDALLRRGEGVFMDIYRKFGVDWDVPKCSPVEFLSRTGALAAQPLLVHCVTVSESDTSIIAESGSRIAHCPKSNAKFGHGYAPLEGFLEAGIPVGLGTDSVASNNVCDLLEEARFAAFSARNREGRKAFISAREVLELSTLGGAKALRLEKKIGTLEKGKEADIAIVSLTSPAQTPVNDVEATLVFSSSARDVIATLVAGAEVNV